MLLREKRGGFNMELTIGYIRFTSKESKDYKMAAIKTLRELAEKKNFKVIGDVVIDNNDLNYNELIGELKENKYLNVRKVFVLSYIDLFNDGDKLKEFLLLMNSEDFEVISYCDKTAIDYLDSKLEIEDTIIRHYYDYLT
jgi:hypothetical protein